MEFKFKWKNTQITFKKLSSCWEKTGMYVGDSSYFIHEYRYIISSINDEINNIGLLNDYRQTLKAAYEDWQRKEATKHKLGI